MTAGSKTLRQRGWAAFLLGLLLLAVGWTREELASILLTGTLAACCLAAAGFCWRVANKRERAVR